jgi:hypothetical protein
MSDHPLNAAGFRAGIETGDDQKKATIVARLFPSVFLCAPTFAIRSQGRLRRMLFFLTFLMAFGGRGGIRTHGGLAPTAVFKTAALNHSATLPGALSRAFRLLASSCAKGKV